LGLVVPLSYPACSTFQVIEMKSFEAKTMYGHLYSIKGPIYTGEEAVLLTNITKSPNKRIKTVRNLTRKCPHCSRSNDDTVYGSILTHFNDGLKVYYYVYCGHIFYDHQLREERKKRVLTERIGKHKEGHTIRYASTHSVQSCMSVMSFKLLDLSPPNWRPHSHSLWYHHWRASI